MLAERGHEFDVVLARAVQGAADLLRGGHLAQDVVGALVLVRADEGDAVVPRITAEEVEGSPRVVGGVAEPEAQDVAVEVDRLLDVRRLHHHVPEPLLPGHEVDAQRRHELAGGQAAAAEQLGADTERAAEVHHAGHLAVQALLLGARRDVDAGLLEPTRHRVDRRPVPDLPADDRHAPGLRLGQPHAERMLVHPQAIARGPLARGGAAVGCGSGFDREADHRAGVLRPRRRIGRADPYVTKALDRHAEDDIC